MTSPFANVFEQQEEKNPFAGTFQEPQQESSPFAKNFAEQEPEQPKEEPSFFQKFLDKFKPKPFKGKIEFITDDELQKLTDPEQRKNLSLTEKKQLVDRMNLQREFEQGIAGSRGLSFGATRALEPDVEFKLLDENAQKVQEGVGSLISFVSTVGPVTKGVSLALPRVAPFITRMVGAGSTAALQDFGDQFFDPEKEVDPIEIGKTFGKMALLDGTLQAAGKAIEFAQNVNRISKVFDVNRGKAFKFVWDEAGKRGLGVGEFAEDARKWADLAEDLAKSAEEGRITLEVPDAKVDGKPIAEIEGPTIEVNPIEVKSPDIDPLAPIESQIENAESQLQRANEVVDSLEKIGERTSEQNKQLAFNRWRQSKLEKDIADLKARSQTTEEPQGISENLAPEVEDPDPTDFSPQEEVTINTSEVEGAFQNALLKDGVAAELDATWNKLGFNVERPFQNIGASETGFQVKNYYSSLAKKEEQTLEAIKNIGNFDKATRSQIALLAEKATSPEDPSLRKAYDEVRKFFDDTFKELQEANVLTNPFPESYIKRLESENALLRQRNQQKIGDEKSNLQAIQENLDLIRELKQTKFVSIPARLWFEKNFDLNRPVTQRTVKILNQRKRKSPTIQSLIDEGLVAPEDVDIAEIMAYYGRRASRDIGLGKILTAAESEGLASRTARPGFVQLPVWQYPAIKDFHIHPKFAEWLTTYANPRQVGLFGRLSSKIKGFTFYNPVILPFNDVVQQIMATQGTGIKYWAQGMRDVLQKTPEFWEAYENGLFSQPYNMFRDDFERQWTRSLTENKTLPQRLKQFFLNDKVVNAVYNASSSIAWSADRVIRMATYRNLLARGMNPREAAQVAALFHGDYAMVNPNMRKQLNTIFYTPTFKIVMGKLYNEMLKSPVRIGRAIMAGEEVPITDKAKFYGLLGTLGIIIGLDQLMTNAWGFDRDQWGRKYSKRVEDDEGVERDLTVNFSNPATLPLKFFWRTVESFSPGNQTALKNLITKNKFELNPAIQIAIKLVNNEDGQGEPIYENFGDDSLTKLAKASVFTAKEVFPFLKQLADEPFEDPEARDKFFEEVGLIFNNIPGAFVYWGQSEEEKKVKQIRQANQELVRRAKRLSEKGESLTEEDLQKYQKLLERIAEE